MEKGKRHKRTGADYLVLCSEILSKAAYRMCREVFHGKKEKFDPKELKEACAAVKEAAAVVNAVERKENSAGETVRIILEDAEEYAQ